MVRLQAAFKYFVVLGASFVLLACQLSPFSRETDKTANKADSAAHHSRNEQGRATLAQLAAAEKYTKIKLLKLSRKTRAQKLQDIYQSILTLEPDPDVRAKVEYRLVQLHIESYEQDETEAALRDDANGQLDDVQTSSLDPLNDAKLNRLIDGYQDLLERFPERPENEFIQYQLAKALDLQGRTDESLKEIETLLSEFPNTEYRSELHFRRGDIYYNLQDYPAALESYHAVIDSQLDDKYRLNSWYMAGWSYFKMNDLPKADQHFIQVLDTLAKQAVHDKHEEFSFSHLPSVYSSLADDAQRVLSISLSQQQQSASLAALIDGLDEQDSQVARYQHILYDNLAQFLVEKELKLDAEQTYSLYIAKQPNTIWAPRFTLKLLQLHQQQGNHPAVRQLKRDYVALYGIDSQYWQLLEEGQQVEFVPHLLSFSLQHARSLFAKAQSAKLTPTVVEPEQTQQEQQFDHQALYKESAVWFDKYLRLAQQPLADGYVEGQIVEQAFLYADASFEAQAYFQALAMYQDIGFTDKYQPSGLTSSSTDTTDSQTQAQTLAQVEAIESYELLAQDAAFASTLTTRQILATTEPTSAVYKQMIQLRNNLDRQFVEKYPDTDDALDIATQAAQYSFAAHEQQTALWYSDFVLDSLDAQQLVWPKTIETTQVVNNNAELLEKGSATQVTPSINNTVRLQPVPNQKLSQSELKKVRITSQLKANSFYTNEDYLAAEMAYQLAIAYVEPQSAKWREMRELVASSIYFQAEAILQAKAPNEELDTMAKNIAVEHFLRLGQIIPESSYRVTADFDAANILLAQENWPRAITVMQDFQTRYPKHEFSATIPAKLAMVYEKMQKWDLAAAQLLVMIEGESSPEVKREAQYTAAEFYLKAGDLQNAILAFRTYAHTYPEPFDIAQEVRFKMADFYQQTKEPNKRYFWLRKILTFHKRDGKRQSTRVKARSNYLASMAGYELGQAHQRTFKWIKLKAPLKQTLQRKQTAMKQAITYYQDVLDLALADFVPKSTFHLAEMYRQLAADIMKSERPARLDELALEEYEILLEELAFPFEEKAIAIHASNAERAWQDIYDEWVKASFAKLASLVPASYQKPERAHHAIRTLH
ncbi:tetratricopeptide repeat protein [Saccharobesus litoralis]|nr:tetratricopeptide repeat protein [Saccharobesus litoralis]